MRWRPIYLPFMLKPIRATIGSFNQLKLVEFQQRFFFLEREQQQPVFSGAVFSSEAAQLLASVRDFLEQKIGIAGAVFLEHKTEAAWLDLYSRFG